MSFENDLWEPENDYPQAPPPVNTGPTHAVRESPRDTEPASGKRRRYMSDGKKYADSAAHRDAAATYATVEVAEAMIAQTAAIVAKTAVLERQAKATEELAQQAHIENIVRFYAALRAGAFPDGVADQLRTHLKIAVAPTSENTFG